jgi:hypothetical protein
MKLTFIFNEMPFPANHGGRVDVWRRIKAFHRAGVRLQLIVWKGDRPEHQPTPEHLAELGKYVEEIHFFTIGSDWASRIRRLVNLTRFSSHVASRALTGQEYRDLIAEVKQFDPAAIWLDAIYGGVLALALAKDLHLPFYVRSHNLEHQYMARQAGLANNLRDKLAWGLAVFHLEAFETGLLAASKHYFDCSYDDLQFWHARGLANGSYLPQTVEPEVDFAGSELPPLVPNSFDVAFMGNLHSPNNVEGLLWFIDRVMPLLLKKRPGISVLIAGSKPRDVILDACKRHPNNITLLPNPENSADVYRAGKVLINPVLSGSGVMVKSIEMLFFDGALVSTKQGIYGVPPEAKACFAVSDQPEIFADFMLALLAGTSHQDMAARKTARQIFGPDSLVDVISRIARDTQ